MSSRPNGVPWCRARSPIGTEDDRQVVQRSGTPAEMKRQAKQAPSRR
ncbi:MAG: hypothetical protein IKD78_07395 [Bacteroidales bacterium]|nr:hypothetical protein [Bacteroidales bacterium]